MYCYQFLSYIIYIYIYIYELLSSEKTQFQKKKKKIPYQQFYITISQFNCQASCTRVHGVIPVECYSLEKMNFKQNCNKQLIEEKESYSETCLNGILNKPKSCINRTLNEVPIQDIFVSLTCIDQTPVYSEHKSWSQESPPQTGLIVFYQYLC